MAKNNKPGPQLGADMDSEDDAPQSAAPATPPPADATNDKAAASTAPPAQPPVTPPATTPSTQPEPPEQPQPQVQQTEEPELPDGLVESFALLAEVEHTPAKHPESQRRKAAFISKIRAHIAVLQNGPPAPIVSANDKAAASKRHAQVTKEARWLYLSRNNAVAAEMFAEIERLRSQLEQVKTTK
ncbi:MAG TPA: hypothetical protein VFB72_21140 [Verrucomicrobiae bacterium]|nr:hypothetical protein [Verrucomicrobiae bacterium]